ncbi:MAG: gamma-glutamyl-gamma-aminobutyrate hydrolase family protein [Nitrospinota bacterium]|nr:gamma-glutamyl-gamma-aminobutyrate hydrolase family protein [Nitrospinota bacterium]
MPARRLPVIGLTADTDATTSSSGFVQERFVLKKAYFDAIIRAGGLPLLIPAYVEPSLPDRYLPMIDGLAVTGGYFDIDPRLYGEEPAHRIDEVKPERTLMEIRLIKKAVRMGMPVLGICGGMQAINVAFGGTLYQDIPAQLPGAIGHEQSPLPVSQPSHQVCPAPGALLARIAGASPFQVNSTHHQGVKRLGKNLLACASSADGLVEAIEGTFKSFLLGVQWHPEQLRQETGPGLNIFKKFMSESRKFSKTCLNAG